MKRKFFFLAVLAVGLLGATPNVQAQAVEKGNFMIDVYYGFPNLMTSLFKAIAEANTDDPNLKIRGIGPFGGKIQYMVGEKIGIGLDVFYAQSSFEYTDNYIDGTTGLPVSYNYKLVNSRPRFLLRGDFHLGDNDVVDPYFGVGLGYNAGNYKFTTTDPFFDITAYNTRNLIPVAYRLAFGTKFYFAPFLGAGVEVGLGGPLLTVGLSGKF